MGRLEVVRRLNIDLKRDVPEFVQQAFIATEDRRFYQHGGLDWRGFFRALATNLRAGRTREGFSTITMQVARNTFAVRRYPARSLRQKFIELSVYTPRRHPERALARRNLVLGLMVKEGYVSANRLPGLQAQPLRIARDEWRPKDPNDSYALDAVRQLVDSIIQGGTADIIDLTVRTTLDRNAQLAADRAIRRQASAIQSEAGRRALVQGAMVGIDPRNGDIRASRVRHSSPLSMQRRWLRVTRHRPKSTTIRSM